MAMNVLNRLDKELQNRSHFTLSQKKRYLYLRICQMFSYDSRYHYCDLLESKERKALKEEILGKKTDLENVTDFTTVCKDYAENIYPRALLELLGIKSNSVGEGHCWVEFEEKNQTMMADATQGDLTRAKFKFATRRYHPVEKNKEYNNELKKIDQEIGYIDFDYEDALLTTLVTVACDSLFTKNHMITEETKKSVFDACLMQEIENERIARNAVISRFPPEIRNMIKIDPSDEVVITKLGKLQQVLKNYQYAQTPDQPYYKLANYEDAKVLIDNFHIKLDLCDIYTDKVNLFQNYPSQDWEFVTIYVYNLKDSILYYVLEKQEDCYIFHEITREDAVNYAKGLKGINKEKVYHR